MNKEKQKEKAKEMAIYEIMKNGKKDEAIHKVAKLLMEVWDFRTRYEEDINEIVFHDGEEENTSGVIMIEIETERIFEKFCTNAVVHEVTEKIKRLSYSTREEKDVGE